MITPPPPEHPAPAKDSINPNGRPDYAEDPHHCEPPDQTQRPSTRHNPGLGIFSSPGSCHPCRQELCTHAQWAKSRGCWLVMRCQQALAFLVVRSRLYLLRIQRIT